MYIKGLRFRGVLKIVEKYWEAELGSICLIYYSISHNHSRSCGQKLAKCTLCAGPHKLKEYKYRGSDYKIGPRKIYTHIKVICVNYQGNY